MPRWRTKTLPGFATSPAKSLMPSRLDFESRPNFVEPAAFVFAMGDQIKQFIKSHESELVLGVGVILISLTSFAAGRLSAPKAEKQAISIEKLGASSFENIISSQGLQASSTVWRSRSQDKVLPVANRQGEKGRAQGLFVASKNSDRYHLPTCIGVKRIAEKNKIWFNSKEEAEGLGYKPASNCPGL